MWTFRAVVARLGGGVCLREDAFWMNLITIAGQMLLKRTERNTYVSYSGKLFVSRRKGMSMVLELHRFVNYYPSDYMLYF